MRFLWKRVSFYFAAIGVISTLVLVSRLNSETKAPAPPIKPAVNPYANTVSAAGIIEAIDENISVGVPVPGLVTKVYVKVWDRVKKNDALFELDSRDLTAQLDVQKANVQVARATLERLRDQLKLLRGVKDPRAVSRDEVRTKENDVTVAEAQLRMAQAQVKQTETLLDRLTIRAPRDGVILQSTVREGQYAALTPADAAMVVGDMDRLQIRADVDEQNAVQVRAGKPATAYIKGRKDLAIPLRFVRIEPMVIPKKSLTGTSTERVDTRVLQVIFALDQQAKFPVYVGQQVDVFIEAPSESAAR